MRTLAILDGCTGSSEYLLIIQVLLSVLSCAGSFLICFGLLSGKLFLWYRDLLHFIVTSIWVWVSFPENIQLEPCFLLINGKISNDKKISCLKCKCPVH